MLYSIFYSNNANTSNTIHCESFIPRSSRPGKKPHSPDGHNEVFNGFHGEHLSISSLPNSSKFQVCLDTHAETTVYACRCWNLSDVSSFTPKRVAFLAADEVSGVKSWRLLHRSDETFNKARSLLKGAPDAAECRGMYVCFRVQHPCALLTKQAIDSERSSLSGSVDSVMYQLSLQRNK